jgi:hypothetical protein
VTSRRRGGEWLLLLGSLLFLVVLLGLAELAVRAFSDVDLLGNSKNLFVAKAWGESNGNAPDVEASSFGQVVYTDEHGFRVPKGGVPGDAQKSSALLILGDSVGFGPAIEESETLAGRLRARFPDMRVYNSSVIGYGTADYRNVVDAFVPSHPEVKAIVLVYCLNDVSSASAQNIDRYLHREPAEPPPRNLTETLRSFQILSDANDYLRARSKLYLFLRHRLLGTQLRDWKLVLPLYAMDRMADVQQSARDIAAIAAVAKARGIPLVVVLSPFEYQLRRPDDPETAIPQHVIGQYLSQEGVPFVDPRHAFDTSVPSSRYFLAYDPMHLSALGHRVVADVIADALARRGAVAGDAKDSGAL